MNQTEQYQQQIQARQQYLLNVEEYWDNTGISIKAKQKRTPPANPKTERAPATIPIHALPKRFKKGPHFLYEVVQKLIEEGIPTEYWEHLFARNKELGKRKKTRESRRDAHLAFAITILAHTNISTMRCHLSLKTLARLTNTTTTRASKTVEDMAQVHFIDKDLAYCSEDGKYLSLILDVKPELFAVLGVSEEQLLEYQEKHAKYAKPENQAAPKPYVKPPSKKLDAVAEAIKRIDKKDCPLRPYRIPRPQQYTRWVASLTLSYLRKHRLGCYNPSLSSG